MKRYTPDHEWITLDGEVATIGISDHAQQQLGDITYVELPEVGRALTKGEAFGVVESVKAASDIYAPVDGTVSEVNEALNDAPEGVNEAPESTGWLIKLTVKDVADVEALMDQAAYDALLRTIE